MIFLFRLAFWTVVVAVLAPSASYGTSGAERVAGLETLQTLKSDTISTLARVRTELNKRHLQAP